MSNVVIINQNESYPYSKKDMCSMCECDESTFRNFWKYFCSIIDNIDKTFIAKGRSHQRFYTEDVLRSFQAWLLKNQSSQGRSSRLVKGQTAKSVATDLIFTELLKNG